MRKAFYFGAHNSNNKTTVVRCIKWSDVDVSHKELSFTDMSLRPSFEARFRWLSTSRNQSLLLAPFSLHTCEFIRPSFFLLVCHTSIV
jgi:hypothetical protein